MRFSQARLLVDDFAAAPQIQAPVDQPDWGGRVAYLRDPSGNLIELFQTLPHEG